MRRLWVIATVIGCSGTSCQGDVHELGTEREVLFELHGRIEGDLRAAAPDANQIRAGLLWAGSPDYSPFCHAYGPNPLEPDRIISSTVANAACRDPFELVPEMPGPSIPIAVDTTDFTLPIDQLPSGEVLIGTAGARVGYAALVVFDDSNGNGELDILRGCRGRFGRDQQDERQTEPIYATSFFSLTEEHTRIAYVEGELDPDSFFYPHPDCNATPPQGFSIWVVGNVLDDAATCRVESVSSEIVLALRDPESLENLSCESSDRETFKRPPPNDFQDDDLLWECTPEGDLATYEIGCPCPEVRIRSLFGCYDEIECDRLEWDLRDSPPDWWPCPLSSGP